MISSLWNFFCDNWESICMIFVGFVAIVVYKMQKIDENKNAAILVVTQIDDLKNKITDIVEIINNNKLDAVSIYETLDILEENQWDKYKHLFVGKIDLNSLRIIDNFYSGVSLIREQLILSKKLQQQSFFNNQQFLGQDSNMYLIQSLDNKYSFNITNIKDVLKKIPEDNEEIKNTKEYLIKNAENLFPVNANPTQFMNVYMYKINELKETFGRQGGFISYLPEQIRVTIDKELSKLSHIEIMGCKGYKELKKIAKIK